MVNPLFTILFDLFLIGSALGVVAYMVTEYLAEREPHIGGGRKTRYEAPARKATVHRMRQQRRRAA